MPIRPIDMMMMPTKSQETSQVQQANNQRLTHAQEQANVHFNQEVQRNAQRPVQAARKNDSSENRYDAKEKGNNKYFASQQKRKEKEEEKEDKKSSGPGNFDIMI